MLVVHILQTMVRESLVLREIQSCHLLLLVNCFSSKYVTGIAYGDDLYCIGENLHMVCTPV